LLDDLIGRTTRQVKSKRT